MAYQNVKSRIPSARSAASGASDGGVGEEDFERAYEDCPDVSLSHVSEDLKRINATLADSNQDWSKRVDCIKLLRSYVKNGVLEDNAEEFLLGLREMDPALVTSVQDLRSQIVREICVTIAYLSKNIDGTGPLRRSPLFEHGACAVMPSLIGTIQKSVKIMATSAYTCSKILLRNTHSHKLVPILTNPILDSSLKESKSNIIRRACCEFISLVCEEWDPKSIGSHVPKLQEAIKKSMTDADSQARAFARDGFKHFITKFPKEGLLLFQTLDRGSQDKVRSLLPTKSRPPTTASVARGKSSETLPKPKPRVPPSKSHHRMKPTTKPDVVDSTREPVSARSNSALDSAAARRAQTRMNFTRRSNKEPAFRPTVARTLGRPTSKPPVSESHYATTKKIISPPALQAPRSSRRATAMSQPASRSSSPTKPSARFAKFAQEGSGSRIPILSASRHSGEAKGSHTPSRKLEIFPGNRQSPLRASPFTKRQLFKDDDTLDATAMQISSSPRSSASPDNKHDFTSNGSRVRSPLGNGSIDGDILNGNSDLITSRLASSYACLHDKSKSEGEKFEAICDVIIIFKQNLSEKVWEDYFGKVLMAIIEIIKLRGEVYISLRMRAFFLISIMAELQPVRMVKYAELTIVEVLEAHANIEEREDLKPSSVIKSAETCALKVGLNLPLAKVCTILKPLIRSTNYPLNANAIKMLGSIIRYFPDSQVEDLIKTHPDVIECVVDQFDRGVHTVTRKECVFTLAYIVHKIGASKFDELPYINSLNSSRKQLINLYVQKTKPTERKSNGSGDYSRN